jgi:choline-sulfatase
MAAQPNILLLMADQLPASALPAWGQSRVHSPRIDSLSEQGVTFDACSCAAPLCAPSRFSLMAGSLPSRIGAWDNACEFPAEVPTLAHYLRAEGYQTTLVGKMHFVGPDQLHGFEQRLTTDIYPADFGWTPDWRHPGVRPDWYHNMLSVLQAGPCFRSNQLDFDDEVSFAARRHLYDLARSADPRPFFTTVSWTHPHDPYAALPRLMDRYREDDIPMPRTRREDVPLDPHSARLRAVSDMERHLLTDEHVRRARHAYFANISYVDEQVGAVLDLLKETGQDRDTIVIFTADHGDMLGERGLWYKMNWFEDSCRVPLVMRGPGLRAGTRVPGPVGSLDLLPTLLSLARDGGDFSPASPIDGVSLVPELGGATRPDRTVAGEYCGEGALAPQLMLRRGPWKWIGAPGDPDQLYHLGEDPTERVNWAQDPAAAAVLEAFQAQGRAHWDTGLVTGRVLASQDRRRLIHRAQGQGRHFPWDYQPRGDASTRFMRNHLVLDDLEFRSRLPRAREVK